MTPGTSPSSSLRDNHARGTVADFLSQHLKPGADLDLVTAYFTATFRKRLAGGLQHSRQFILPTVEEPSQPDSDFELVTWLVLLAP